ncbi:hypothetical protein MLD38_009903 [Melastoma candidum]|uniref:Uncharacterized protein n=1 Tax=Melastoma candidum TaxID=119954 RepID=A0ACB9S2R3_9MYRT|nr:hypothetical protein MLD38_009903 [Melastoma candidum]
MEKAAARPIPTGCYKCGRPGHWSRDCPSGPSPNSDPNPNADLPPLPKSKYDRSTGGPRNGAEEDRSGAGKPRKVPRARPKLTPQLLLSDDGIGYVLRHFPRNFKYRGRGHEVSDLGKLIGMYREWHSHLIPYYSFDQFMHKVEQVAASKQVKKCIRDLKERVANGGDPSTLREPPPEDVEPNDDQVPLTPVEDLFAGEKNGQENESAWREGGPDEYAQDMLNEIYEEAANEHFQSSHGDATNSVGQTADKGGSAITTSSISDEQRARMELNRRKALEKASARAHS